MNKFFPCFEPELYDPGNNLWPPFAGLGERVGWHQLPFISRIFNTRQARQVGIKVAFEMLIECGIWNAFVRETGNVTHLSAFPELGMDFFDALQDWNFEGFKQFEFQLQNPFPDDFTPQTYWAYRMILFITESIQTMNLRSPVRWRFGEAILHATAAYSYYWVNQEESTRRPYGMLRYYIDTYSGADQDILLSWIFKEEWRKRCLESFAIDRFRFGTIS